MTWPAWEMPRPGCVWTHTLLLDSEALAACEPSQLLQFFRRPAGPEPDLGEFVESLDLVALAPVRTATLRGRAKAWAARSPGLSTIPRSVRSGRPPLTSRTANATTCF